MQLYLKAYILHTYLHDCYNSKLIIIYTIACWMLLSNQTFELEQHEVEGVEVMSQWVARSNIQQTSYISQTEQHSPLGLMLLRLGNVI